MNLGVRGKLIEYKYSVCKDTSHGMFEDIEHNDIYYGTVNRALKIPGNFAGEYFDQYDDVILMNNAKRREYRKKATRAFLPSFKKIVNDRDYQSLHQKVIKFERVIQCHTNGIMFVQDYGRGRNHQYRTQHESLKYYDSVCNEIASQWTNNLFDTLKEIQEKVRNSNDKTECKNLLKPLVFGSIFYILLHHVIHNILPDISKEKFEIIIYSLSPMIHEGKCLKLETVCSILETSQKREAIAEAF